MRVAPKYGHSVSIYGDPIWYVPELQFSMDIRSLRSRRLPLRVGAVPHQAACRMPSCSDQFPRRNRLIVDTDGMYNPLIHIDDYDFNHRNEPERAQWIDYIEALGDSIVQTTLERPANPKAGSLTFFGYNPALEVDPASAPPKKYDILHVGHNWWRWREVSTELLPAIGQVREQIGEIGFVGLWWDAPPPEGPGGRAPKRRSNRIPRSCAGCASRPAGRDVHDVIQTMSSARINIFTQRPVLRHLQASDAQVFRDLLRRHDPAADARPRPRGGRLRASRPRAGADGQCRREDCSMRCTARTTTGTVVEDVRRHLAAHYSYDRRVEELVAAMPN